MRTVMIVHDGTDKRQWVAKDSKTGAPLLRLQERYQLEAMCLRLEWTVAGPQRMGAEPENRRASAR
jgi:hypothetical protein